MADNPLLDLGDPSVYVEPNETEVTIKVIGPEVFGTEGTARVRALFDAVEHSGYKAVTLDLRQVQYFCSTSLGRIAECVARLQRDERELRVQAKGYSLQALRAIGFDHVVTIIADEE